MVLRTFVTVVTSLGVSVASTLIINGVIGQYVCKMNRCDAPVLESRNRRQLASTTSQRCRAVLMGLAIETTKTKESGREYESGYLCPRYFDSIKKYLALHDKLDSIRKDPKQTFQPTKKSTLVT